MIYDVDPTDVAVLIENGAESLKTKGWTQHFIGPEEGPNCLLGSLGYRTSRRRETDTPLVRAAEAEIKKTLISKSYEDFGMMTIPAFNDADGRTVDEVIDVMISTAKDIRNRV